LTSRGPAVRSSLTFSLSQEQPPEHQQLADVDGRSIQFFSEHVFAACTVADGLDVPSRAAQGGVDFFTLTVRAVRPIIDIEMVRFSAVVFALGRGKVVFEPCAIIGGVGRRRQ
jgi:hypothetical protein